jgi:predicted GNAT superfamily acetyltransferase
VLIRPFAEHAVAPALALNNACIPDVNELDDAAARRLLSISELALAAEVDGRFAGFCWTMGPGQDYESLNYAWFSSRYDDFAYLDRIAVHPDFRRYGIGRAFYTDLRDRLSDVRPVLLCEVNLRPRNERSLQFHAEVGFSEVGQQDTDGGTKTVSLLAMPLG